MHSDPRPPVTILCGFLGAGKTTLLNHLLGQTEGERWALVVNDVAAVNMDARQVAVRVEALSGVEAPPIVELGNGCVCCSSKDDLADSLIQLALTGRPGGPGGRPYDRIVVETTGVAEPKEIARLFTQRNPFGRSPGDVARLAALVTVVDAGAFLRLWREAGPLRSGPLPSAHPVAAAAPRPLIELLIEQVETTDLVVLNKCDRVTAEERAILEAAIAGLNPRADIIAAEQGQVPREIVMDPIRFSERETLGGAAWIRALNALAPIPASAAMMLFLYSSSRLISSSAEELLEIRATYFLPSDSIAKFLFVKPPDNSVTDVRFFTKSTWSKSAPKVSSSSLAPDISSGYIYAMSKSPLPTRAKIVIIGGGDSAFDWAYSLAPIAKSVTLVHRRDTFRAHAATVDQVRAMGVELIVNSEVESVAGDDWIESVTIKNKEGESRTLPAQTLVAALGFIANIGPIANWGIELEKRRILVDTTMKTNLPRVYSAGDITTYVGKVPLISVGFGEAGLAVNNSVPYIDEHQGVFPGHSSGGGE